MDPVKVLIGKRTISTYLPDMSVREDLLLAWGEVQDRSLGQKRRVWAAAIGLCSRIGREAKVDFAACKFDVYDYGGRIYRHLVDVEKLSLPGIQAIAVGLLTRCSDGAFPRENEVVEAEGNSDAVG